MRISLIDFDFSIEIDQNFLWNLNERLNFIFFVKAFTFVSGLIVLPTENPDCLPNNLFNKNDFPVRYNPHTETMLTFPFIFFNIATASFPNSNLFVAPTSVMNGNGF